MGRRNRHWYEVRSREGADVEPEKRSRFREAACPSDAARRSRSGTIIRVRKVSREKVLGVGEFFTLGDALMKEFKQQKGVKFASPKESTETSRPVGEGI